MDGSFITMTDEEQENLLRAIETSLQVKKRHQFFLWSQGPLQAFVPHDIMICMVIRDGKEIKLMDRFNTCIVSPETFESVCDPVDGLVVQMMNAWREIGDAPLLVTPDSHLPSSVYDRLSEQLERVGFGHAAGHGSAPIEGSGITSSFFFFAGIPCRFSFRHAYFMELLMPHIHMAFVRTFGQSAREVSVSGHDRLRFGDVTKLMTEREIEILSWVQQGKSNQEIGAILNISQLTVKNHVQKVLRKLDVRNRAQAVSKATALRIINYAT